MKLYKNISLLNYNTLRIDATAENLILIDDSQDFDLLLKEKDFKQKNKFFLGAGSNLLITQPIKDLTIKNTLTKINIIQEDAKSILLEVDSGMDWHSFVTFCVNNGYYGLENLALIPGSVGAAPVQNIGAYGLEQKKCFHSLDCVDLFDGKNIHLSNSECKFYYRYSIFKESEYKNLFITKVRYKLSKIFQPEISYKDLKQYFDGKKNISARDVFDAVVEIRNKKLPDYRQFPNAGSFFKNPIVDKEKLSQLLLIEPNLVYFDLNNGLYKISAANLIEKAGLKGFRKNNVGISTKHSLIIVNFDNASGQEVLEFSKYIQSKIYEKFKVELEPEVIVI